MQFSQYIISADISPEMPNAGKVTKVKVLFLVLVFVFNFDLFKFSAAILEKGLLPLSITQALPKSIEWLFCHARFATFEPFA